MAFLITGIVVGAILWILGRSLEQSQLKERERRHARDHARRMAELTPWDD